MHTFTKTVQLPSELRASLQLQLQLVQLIQGLQETYICLVPHFGKGRII